VGFDQGVFEVALTTSVVLVAGIVIVGRLSFSRRARKTTA